jgi:hypothetical protein
MRNHRLLFVFSLSLTFSAFQPSHFAELQRSAVHIMRTRPALPMYDDDDVTSK